MNIADLLVKRAKEHPSKIAIRVSNGRTSEGAYNYQEVTFLELLNTTRSIANGLSSMGLKSGDKALVFVRPGLDFPAITFALFSIGAIPVFIDPGMGKKNLLHSIKQVRPKALIAVPLVHFLRLIKRDAFRSVEHFVTTGDLAWGSMKSLSTLKKSPPSIQEIKIDENSLAAILFTSGGTGIPKGVEYTHKIFSTQTKLLQSLFGLTSEDVDIPGFPLFALFTIAMGMTSCVPDMDPSKPANASAEKLVQNILDNKATFVAGSPAIWHKVATYCKKRGITLPSVKYLVMFGAPVSRAVHTDFREILTHGTTYTPYGATESLRVSNISGKYLLEHTIKKSLQGKGTCIGKPVPFVEVKIIKITDDIISDVASMQELPIESIGEIIVKGEAVTKSYFEMPNKTAEAKIYDGDQFWHRIGDLGYFDKDGYLWFCGRKSHRVETQHETMSTVQCEAIFNEHEAVEKSALVGVYRNQEFQTPELVVQVRPSAKKDQHLKDELLLMAQQFEHTKNIKKIWFHDSFPVDVRHNIKIDRLKLRDLAQEGLLE